MAGVLLITVFFSIAILLSLVIIRVFDWDDKIRRRRLARERVQRYSERLAQATTERERRLWAGFLVEAQQDLDDAG